MIISKSASRKFCPKLLIFGLAGSGKSSLADTLPDALFLDLEGGATFVRSDLVEIVNGTHLLTTLQEILMEIKTKKFQYKYVVIDSLDWLIFSIKSKVSGSDQGKTLTDKMNSALATLNKSNGGYGNGKQALENYNREIVIKLLDAINRSGIGVVLTAHADRKELLDSDGTNVERLAPKMDIDSMNAYVEWVDCMFYLQRHEDGTRELFVNPTDVISAKNRLGEQATSFLLNKDFDLHKFITTPQDKTTQSTTNQTKENK